MLALLALVARAACPDAWTADDLRSVMDTAEAQLGSWGADDAVLTVEEAVPCLVEPLGPEQAARLHRVLAAGRLVAEDVDLAELGFAAALAIDPGGSLSWEASLDVQAAAARLPAPPVVVLPPDPQGRRVLIDGVETDVRPIGRPVLIQRVGDAVETTWLPADADLGDVEPPPTLAVRPRCDVRPARADVEREAGAAQTAWLKADQGAFGRARAAASAGAACTREPLTRAAAAALHRVDAFGAIQADPGAALRSLTAAAIAQPEYPLPSGDAAMPLETPWRLAHGRRPGPSLALHPPPGMTTLVDGAPSARRPVLRPAWVQLVDDDGRVVWGGRVDAGAPSPAWPADVFGPVGAEKVDRPGRRRTGALVAIGSALLGGAGVVLHQQVVRAGEVSYPSLSAAEQEAYRGDLAPYALIGVGLAGVGAAGVVTGVGLLATSRGAR